MIDKDILNRIEHLEELAGVKKEAEQWPKGGNDYWFQDDCWRIVSEEWGDDSFDMYRIKNIILFKTKEDAEKYYSIIDTINNIVDELGRPSWGDFEKDAFPLWGIEWTYKREFRECKYICGYLSEGILPYCKKPYLEKLLEKVSQTDLLWAFKKSMRLV